MKPPYRPSHTSTGMKHNSPAAAPTAGRRAAPTLPDGAKWTCKNVQKLLSSTSRAGKQRSAHECAKERRRSRPVHSSERRAMQTRGPLGLPCPCSVYLGRPRGEFQRTSGISPRRQRSFSAVSVRLGQGARPLLPGAARPMPPYAAGAHGRRGHELS